jgi:hypothetical protein
MLRDVNRVRILWIMINCLWQPFILSGGRMLRQSQLPQRFLHHLAPSHGCLTPSLHNLRLIQPRMVCADRGYDVRFSISCV